MARTPKDVTDAELAVLQALWDLGPSSARDLADRLYPGGGNSEYATVQKLCERLEAKGCVVRDRGRRPHHFEATVDREALIARQLQSVADRLTDGEYVPLINHLMRGSSLSAREIERLREQVDQLDTARRKRRKS